MAAGGHFENFKCPYLCSSSWMNRRENYARAEYIRLAMIENISFTIKSFTNHLLYQKSKD